MGPLPGLEAPTIDAGFVRDCAFKLRPLSLSNDLIDQLKACAMKLDQQADELQTKITEKCNQNKDYVDVINKAPRLV